MNISSYTDQSICMQIKPRNTEAPDSSALSSRSPSPHGRSCPPEPQTSPQVPYQKFSRRQHSSSYPKHSNPTMLSSPKASSKEAAVASASLSGNSTSGNPAIRGELQATPQRNPTQALDDSSTTEHIPHERAVKKFIIRDQGPTTGYKSVKGIQYLNICTALHCDHLPASYTTPVDSIRK